MKPEYIALIASFLSLLVAATALGWNIYRDVVLKPRLKVSVSKRILLSENLPQEVKLLLSAVNHGPGKIRLNSVFTMESSILKRMLNKRKIWYVIHDYKNPISGQLPITLDVGETIDLVFPWSKESLLSTSPSHVGIKDSFGRTHWAPSKEVTKIVADWRADFPKTKL